MPGEWEYLVRIEGISKKFCRSRRAAARHLSKQLLNSFARTKYNTVNLGSDEFWALHNLSLNLRRGEVLGVIGLNGSGKSTLLKLINGLILPDSGSLTIGGTVGGLIELGAGFQLDLTGRENIFIKGALQGKSKAEMNLLFDSIVEFSELEDFIDLPVKNYSSGMQTRLGFAISIFQDPDVLLMDEVLAVGDFNFQQKCLAKVNEMRSSKAIVLVSHSMNSVRLFCDRVAVLEHGSLVFDGEPDDAISFYLHHSKRVTQADKASSLPGAKGVYGEMFRNDQKVSNVQHSWCKHEYDHGAEMKLLFSFEINFEPHRLIVGVPIWNGTGLCITAMNSDYSNYSFNSDSGVVHGSIAMPCHLNPGVYESVFAIVDGSEFLYRQRIAAFTVKDRARLFGFVTFPQTWSS